MTSEGLLESFVLREAAEMEGLGPAVLVEIGGKVVVLASQGGIFFATLLADFIGLDRSGFVVPVWLRVSMAYASLLAEVKTNA